MRQWFDEFTLRQRIGGVLFLAGAIVTGSLAYFGSTQSPPAAATQALTAFLGISAQAGAVWLFSSDGRADPALAERAIARLAENGRSAAAARKKAECMYEADPQLPPEVMRREMGQLSVILSYVEQGYAEALADWNTFKPRIVKNITEEADAEQK